MVEAATPCIPMLGNACCPPAVLTDDRAFLPSAALAATWLLKTTLDNLAGPMPEPKPLCALNPVTALVGLGIRGVVALSVRH